MKHNKSDNDKQYEYAISPIDSASNIRYANDAMAKCNEESEISRTFPFSE